MKSAYWIPAILLGVTFISVLLIGNEKKPTIEIRRITPMDDSVLEEWERVTSEPDIVGASAAKLKRPKWNWQVFINAAEFVRKEPLAGRLEKNITASLKKIEGVSAVVREDTEVWLVQGEVNGESLVRACSVALDQLAPEIRKQLGSMR